MLESIHVSVQKITSGFVLSTKLLILHCLVFIDWQLIFKILIGAVLILPLVLLFLIGVEACMGLTLLVFVGLVNDDVFERIENWFEVLNIWSKHTEL